MAALEPKHPEVGKKRKQVLSVWSLGWKKLFLMYLWLSLFLRLLLLEIAIWTFSEVGKKRHLYLLEGPWVRKEQRL